MRKVVEVAVALPLHKTFYYHIPERMRDFLQIGMRVLVPFGARIVTGFAIELLNQVPKGVEEKLREVEDILDEIPLINPPMLRFYRWISDYYLYPLGEVIKNGLPPGLHLKSELIVSLTQDGKEVMTKGHLESVQEEALKEIERSGKVSLKRVLKLFSGEFSRTQLFSLKKKGILKIEAEIRGREIKPRWERWVKYQGIEPNCSFSKKQEEILNWIKEKGEISWRELNKRFRSSSKSIRALQTHGVISIFAKEVCQDLSTQSELKPYPRPELTPHQKKVLDEISKGIHSKRYSPFLLFGVTGSGKTEIYLRAIEEVLTQGREAIVLVPEISLTPQLLSRFKDRFGENIALLHSGLALRERYDQWRRIWKGEAKIAIGARSAIFAPFKDVGIIIVDEEHDPSYKQEDKLKYHARDVAIVRAKQAEATILLGSATPSLESFDNAHKGKFHLLHLPERIEGKPLPRVEIADMREEEGLISKEMRRCLERNIEGRRQSLLFLNRRGFANFILCPECGYTFKCPNCSVTLTYHLQERRLQCHYCNYQIQAPGDCPKCQGHQLRGVGIGTERLEQEIKSLFPAVQVGRMDRDTTSKRRSHLQILKRFESGNIDILIGTQMIVKGHDFPNITFVGVLSADLPLHFPDFRSSERTFQLLTQVAGRAGRGEDIGEVVIQTYNPDHYSILRAKDHDYLGFFQEEIQFRKALQYPPFSRLINFRLIGNNEKKTRDAAQAMGKIGEKLIKKGYGKWIEILGPSASPYPKMKGKFRWQMLAKGESHSYLHWFAREISSQMEIWTKRGGVHLDIDVDPISIL